MSEHTKRVEDLTVADIAAAAVWQFTNSDEHIGETAVRPIKKTPVKNLNGRLVGVQVRLANGSNVWADMDGSNNLQTHRLYLDTVDSVFARISSAGTAAWFTPWS